MSGSQIDGVATTVAPATSPLGGATGATACSRNGPDRYPVGDEDEAAGVCDAADARDRYWFTAFSKSWVA